MRKSDWLWGSNCKSYKQQLLLKKIQLPVLLLSVKNKRYIAVKDKLIYSFIYTGYKRAHEDIITQKILESDMTPDC